MIDEVDVLVAGSGMAGLSAAAFVGRYGLETLVLTGETHGGHMLSVGIAEDVIGFQDAIAGYDLFPAIQEQASAAGAQFESAGVVRLERIDDRLRVETDRGTTTARAVILASGSELRELGVPGESRLKGHGVSSCASCDGPLFRGRTAAVVGGGDSALQESLELAQHVDEVILLVRDDSLSGQHSYVRRVVDHPRIDVRYGTTVEEIVGGTLVEGVVTRGVHDGERSLVEVAAVFAFVGLAPGTGYLSGFIELDDEGRVPTDNALRTRTPGVFAAGDVRSGAAGQASAAIGDGVAAAVSANTYLKDGRWPSTSGTWSPHDS